MTGDEDGIVFADGISRVVLRPAGPPALGHPTSIEVRSGPFSAVLEAEAWGYEEFRDALQRMHETLSGEAVLTFVEGGHHLTLTGDGRGHVEADIVIEDGRSPCRAVLTLAMSLDQSHLPALIHAIRRHFVPRP